MTILQFWAIAVILCLMFWGLLFRAAFGQEQVMLKDMLSPSPYAHMYWPPACVNNVCVLTGLGGFVSVWEEHIDYNLGSAFVVRGICASACEIAYQRALTIGEIVVVAPGAELIVHAPSSMILKN